MTTLEAAGLLIEPLAVSDAESLFEVLSDPAIYRHLDYGPPISREHLRGVYEKQVAGRSADGRETWLNWVVRLPGHGPIGYVQATVLPDRKAWIAYVLASGHWGRGYAHAATQAMLAHLGLAHGVVEFLATVEAANERSIRLLERLSFRPASAQEAAAHGLSATERLYVRA